MIRREDLKNFEQAALAFIDEDGYPSTIPVTPFERDGTFAFRLPRGVEGRKIEGKRVNLLLNHITPIPSGGYTDRRYVGFKGSATIREELLELKAERKYGWDEKVTPFPEYVEVSTPRAKSYLEDIGKKLGYTFKPGIGLFWTVFRAVRMPFLVATATPVTVGAAAAFYQGFFDPLLFALTLLGLSFIHLALNVANDYFDTLLGADVLNKRPTPFSGGSRAIIYGILNPQEARILYSSLFAAGVSIGAFLAMTRGVLEIVSLTALGFFLSYYYTAPPIKLAYRGLGELAVFLGFGPVIVMGTYFVQAQSLSLSALMASIPMGILVMQILYVNEIPDAPYDRQAGKMTLLTRLSRKQALVFLATSMTATYLSIALIPLLRLGPPTVLAALATIPLSYKVFRGVVQSFGEPYSMIGTMSLNVKNTTLTGLLIAAGYVAGALV
ncbi:MAG: prenyltransferase [Nitrososphaerota archaeon]|nr:prenyltransferase [Candidatus Calditenuaceae archaeon]MDW8072979.1 prenyltransferase [Nitrososphaerota archaeon]